MLLQQEAWIRLLRYGCHSVGRRLLSLLTRLDLFSSGYPARSVSAVRPVSLYVPSEFYVAERDADLFQLVDPHLFVRLDGTLLHSAQLASMFHTTSIASFSLLSLHSLISPSLWPSVITLLTCSRLIPIFVSFLAILLVVLGIKNAWS